MRTGFAHSFQVYESDQWRTERVKPRQGVELLDLEQAALDPAAQFRLREVLEDEPDEAQSITARIRDQDPIHQYKQ
jgi:hypothetical protein